jgi:hypothetical protein
MLYTFDVHYSLDTHCIAFCEVKEEKFETFSYEAQYSVKTEPAILSALALLFAPTVQT